MALNTVVLITMATGFAPAAAGAPYTVPSGKKAIIKDIWFANTDSVAHTITLRVTPSGQASSNAFALVPALVLAPAGAAGAMLQASCSTNMQTGDFLDLIADVAGKIACRISGVEVA
jgi:hypothetical protein